MNLPKLSPETRRRLHLLTAIFFMIQMPLVPIVFDDWFEQYLTWLSQWALVASHLAGVSAEERD